MHKGRLEAFSDGVLVIIVTIMVLELKVPEGAAWQDLWPLLPKFLSYALSFLMVLIYWNSHHHLMQTIKTVNGKIMLANGLWLFVISLLPFATSWMGENDFQSNPVILQGVIFILAGFVSRFLSLMIIKSEGSDSILAKLQNDNWKGTISWISYSIGITLAFYYPGVSAVIYFFVAFMWLVPDKRIEHFLKNN
ncbi:MAG: DUF1211 domain-containing protein [Bacteroidetes Order II. Incertae sedis bacterium]|nr:DUF1211 domain-containing protein [Bacteroidetes Order II. bacterium]